MMKAKSTYNVKKWDEKTFAPVAEDLKMTNAAVEYEFDSGDLDGKASVNYVMCYTHVDPKDEKKNVSSYVGMIKFSGKIAGREGSFVMEDHGVFQEGEATSEIKIIEGSGDGELKKIRGTGTYRAGKDGNQIWLDYRL